MPTKRRSVNWLALWTIYLVFWGFNIVIAVSANAMEGMNRGELGGTLQVGFFVLGFPVAFFAFCYLLMRLITRLTGRPGGLFLVVGFLLLMGLLSFGTGVFETVEGLRSATYPTVQGTILSSAERTDSSTSSSSDDIGSRRKTTYTYYFDVSYEYEVAGKTYQGKEYDVSSGSLPQNVAYALPDQFPAGSFATVFYDPGHPQTAYLKPGLAGTWYLLLIVGVILLGLGGTGFWWLEKKHRERNVKNDS